MIDPTPPEKDGTGAEESQGEAEMHKRQFASRDAAPREAAAESLAEKFQARHPLCEGKGDFALADIDQLAELVTEAQALQRKQDAPYMQHLPKCAIALEKKANTGNWCATTFSRCTCGLAAIHSRDQG